MAIPARTYPPGGFPREDAAFYLGVSVRTLDDLQRQGLLIPKRLGSKRLFLKDELDRYLAALPDWNDDAA